MSFFYCQKFITENEIRSQTRKDQRPNNIILISKQNSYKFLPTTYFIGKLHSMSSVSINSQTHTIIIITTGY